jgi:broad specificity phosphatase PhoE
MIYVVRHGQTDWNLEGKYQGKTDIELNQTGISQAEELKHKLKGIKFDVVFSSPLKRAHKTAKIIYDGEVFVDDRIMERGNGALEGMQKNNTIVNFTDPDERRFGIEPLPHFRKRISEFWDEIVKKYCGKDILVVTHAGVGIYTQCYFSGEPKNGDYNQYKIKNCTVLRFEN